MRPQGEHRQAAAHERWAAQQVARAPDEHRRVLWRELQRRREERERLRSARQAHRQTLERLRDQLSWERTYHRRAYEQNRWWIELVLQWWEARRAA
jgi:hypothetical protein